MVFQPYVNMDNWGTVLGIIFAISLLVLVVFLDGGAVLMGAAIVGAVLIVLYYILTRLDKWARGAA